MISECSVSAEGGNNQPGRIKLHVTPNSEAVNHNLAISEDNSFEMIEQYLKFSNELTSSPLDSSPLMDVDSETDCSSRTIYDKIKAKTETRSDGDGGLMFCLDSDIVSQFVAVFDQFKQVQVF